MRKTKVEKRNNEIVNRLNRTKREDNPDLAARREAFDQVGDELFDHLRSIPEGAAS